MAGGSDSFTEETSLALDEESSKVAESRASADVGTATGWAKEQACPLMAPGCMSWRQGFGLGLGRISTDKGQAGGVGVGAAYRVQACSPVCPLCAWGPCPSWA